jgi:hypothetical protein
MITQGTGALRPRSSISIRSPQGQSLAERQRAARGLAHHKPIARQKTEIQVSMGPAVYERLTEVAEQKALPIETVLAQIIGGVVCRGSIDQALGMWGDYEVDARAESFSSHRRRKRDQKRNGDGV